MKKATEGRKDGKGMKSELSSPFRPSVFPSPSHWEILLDPIGAPGPVNMSIDRELLDQADRSGVATLRLYRFNPPCLSFGRNEAATRHYDRAEIERLGIDVVRRPTGGRAVWHEHEVTYAVAAPIETFGSLREAYCGVHERISAGLRLLGVDAELAPDAKGDGRTERRNGDGSCFSVPVAGEILVQGRKLVGSAQVRKGSAFLQHGSILLDLVRNPFADFGNATSLSAVLGRTVPFQEVAEAIADSWDGSANPTALYRSLPLTTALFSAASSAQFHSPLWTWRR